MKNVILAGGSGSRLFPLSRELFPKQFLKLEDDKSFFQKTVLRNLDIVKSLDNMIISTNEKYKFLIINHIRELFNLDKEKAQNTQIILEPEKKNTAGAIALSVKYLLEKGVSPKEVVFVTPSDHLIKPEDEYIKYIKYAEGIAEKGYIITFGINPSRVETGYGYIEADHLLDNKNNFKTFKVKKFHEKPDLETAEKYLMFGNFFWNSGMFMFSIETIVEEFKNLSPDIYEKVINAENLEKALENYRDIEDISFDYAIMEKTQKAVVIPMYLTWSDIGSFDSLFDIMDKDEFGNVKKGEVINYDTKNSLIIGNKRLIATIDLENIIVVETEDVLLLAKRGDSQRVKDLVKDLEKSKKYREYVLHSPKVYRPWGSYTELEKGERYRIKRLTIYPGETLSLQLHHHRSEHWVVVKGVAKVILEDDEGELKEYYIHENESIYVPKSTKHRLENPGKIPLEVIEVQIGEYIEEDDIIRFSDIYGRK
jgi:mannose-1-phosphate guanylyltransferase/mannose-6-phosphate isomerase